MIITRHKDNKKSEDGIADTLRYIVLCGVISNRDLILELEEYSQISKFLWEYQACFSQCLKGGILDACSHLLNVERIYFSWSRAIATKLWSISQTNWRMS